MARTTRWTAMILSAWLTATAIAQDPNSFQQPIAVDGQQRPSMRLLFAQSLAAAAQALGSSLVVNLTQALTGGLTSWLDRRAQRRQQRLQSTADSPLPPQPQFFSAETGQAVAADPNLIGATTVASSTEQSAAEPPAAEPQVPNTTLDLFAGLAFEVHSQSPDGTTAPVNPATHDFRTGDRFVIFFRPTLPGHMEVYNINAAGSQTQIDLQVIAAGQLARLGPYEFAALTGDEQLKLVIVPCTSPALAVATRDIVNVAAGTENASSQVQTGEGIELSTCAPAVRSIGRVRTRDIRTRDIRNVAVEGSTGFALDPVSPQERTSGRLAPREVTILLRHR
jgi:hypothetical protein